jgi:hypothetical protein
LVRLALPSITSLASLVLPASSALKLRVFVEAGGPALSLSNMAKSLFGSGTGRQTPPVRSSLRLCDLLGGADNPLRLNTMTLAERRSCSRLACCVLEMFSHKISAKW